MIEAVPQTSKQIERRNLPTFPYETSFLNPVLEEIPYTLIVIMDLTLFNEF
jgi:hypothetical protein